MDTLSRSSGKAFEFEKKHTYENFGNFDLSGFHSNDLHYNLQRNLSQMYMCRLTRC